MKIGQISYVAKKIFKNQLQLLDSTFEKSTFELSIRWIFVQNFITLALLVWSETTVSNNQNGQNLNFMNIGQKIILANKYF